jgi:hypothetical protein
LPLETAAFLTNITGVAQAGVVNVEGGWPDQITFHPERVIEAHFSPVEDQLVLSRDIGGNVLIRQIIKKDQVWNGLLFSYVLPNGE